MKPALQFRLHQQLALTPQLQLAIRLLQLSQLELEAELRTLTESNPLLEFTDDAEPEGETDADTEAAELAYASGTAATSTADEPDTDGEATDWAAEDGAHAETPIDFSAAGGATGNAHGDDDFEPQNAAPETLQQHLLWQLNLAGFDARQTVIATVLIDSLNADGYLADGVEAVRAALPDGITASLEEIDTVRRRLQGFDPLGVASLDLRDCLRCQLEQLDVAAAQRELALAIVDGELELLARNDIARLAHKLKADADDVSAAAALIRRLDPRPGAALDATPVEYIAPDAYAVKAHGRWEARLNADAQPRLGLNQHYCNLIGRARGNDATWMKGQLQEARWLLKSLESRADTLQKVASAIVRRQSAFLDYGAEAMRPLVLREVAEEVGMHESTISRVTTRKYLHTPRGIFELKYFFSSSLTTEDGGSASATAIQAMLRKLIDAEDPTKPLSDQALAQELQGKGIQVARRTVAKYREGLRIPSSSERLRAG